MMNDVETAGTILAREMRRTTLSEEERREVLLHNFPVASRPQHEQVGFISRGAELRMRKIKLHRHREWKRVN